jgi:hypothetical protein
MKKTGLIFATLFLLGIGNVYAQDGTANVAVTATVESALNFVTDPATIEFGTVQSGQTATVDADPAGTDVNASAPQRATITIENSSDEEFQVTYTNAILTDAGGSNPTAFTTALYVVSGTDVDNTSIASGSNFTSSGTGDIVLSVGGVLDAINATNAGSYSTANAGGQEITVEFNLVSI